MTLFSQKQLEEMKNCVNKRSTVCPVCHKVIIVIGIRAGMKCLFCNHIFAEEELNK